VLPVRETVKHTDRVIADGRYPESLLPDRVQMLFPVDELDLAERSPIRRTAEHEHSPFRAHDGFEGLVPGPPWSCAEKSGTCWPKSGPVLMIWPCNSAIRRVHIATSMRDLFPIRAIASQNVNVSSSAIMMTGGPPDDILTAWAKVSLPPADAAHCWSASMDGK
jgi:hypothetical protein